MIHAARVVAALAVLGLAVPAFACSDHEGMTKTTTASAEKAPAKAKTATVKKAKAAAKKAPEQKPVTASN